MPVKLFTGLPGAGKTACLVAELIRLQKEEPERPVFAMGINGLAEGVAQSLTVDQLRRWWELPPGAIIAIDEAQEEGLMPLDQGKPAEWVKRISKVRHEGMDFLLTTQHPGMLSSYVRRLVDQHVHAVRKFNTQVVMRYTWGRCMDNCEKDSAQKAAVVQVGTLPKEVFDLYKSSNAHNMKRRVPLKAFMLPILAVVAVGAAVAVPIILKRIQANSQKAALGVASVSPNAGPSQASADAADAALRRSDPAKWMAPRVPGLLWTAPAFDHLAVKATPRVFCIAVEDGSTHCVTEQGTDVDVPPATARAMAAHGVYNPFVDADAREREGRAPVSARADAAQSSPPASLGSSGSSSATPGSLLHVGIHDAYVPPAQGPWNPEGG